MPKESEKVIKIALLHPPKPEVIPTPQPVIPTPPKPKKEEPKKVEPKPKPKPKKVIKKPKPKPKKVVKKPVPKPKPTPPPVVEEFYVEPKVVTTPTPVKVAPTPTPPQPKVDLNAHKRAFLKSVRGSIYANKQYPAIAKRRNIQGTVHVVFDIDKSGQISNIRTSGASKILQKAARKSILKSSPFNVPSILSSRFPMNNVSINIDFKLQ